MVTTPRRAAVPFKEMTEEQKQASYQAWLEKQEGRQVTSKSRRAAVAELIKKHQKEYNGLLEHFKAELGGDDGSEEDKD